MWSWPCSATSPPRAAWILRHRRLKSSPRHSTRCVSWSASRTDWAIVLEVGDAFPFDLTSREALVRSVDDLFTTGSS